MVTKRARFSRLGEPHLLTARPRPPGITVGGSERESNPPPRPQGRANGFEVREAHQDPSAPMR